MPHPLNRTDLDHRQGQWANGRFGVPEQDATHDETVTTPITFSTSRRPIYVYLLYHPTIPLS